MNNKKTKDNEMQTYKHLLSPIQIGKIEIPNRVVMPAMGTKLGEKGGRVSPAQLAYYRHMASGGTGLIISEITAVHPTGATQPAQPAAWDDEFIPSLRSLAQAMGSGGGRTALQLHHAGRETIFQLLNGTALAPSATPSPVYRRAAREMTREDISEIITAFGAAARRAQEAGFSMVEVHGAHGYLLTQFLSERVNRRTDEYGGSLANRARFMLEVIAEVRAQVGSDYPVIVRLSAEEFIKGGYTLEEAASLAPEIIAAGADAIHASIGTHGSPGSVTTASPEYAPGFNAWRAAALKKAVSVPIIAVGRYTHPLKAEEDIAQGKADLVAFGRQHLADARFLAKAIKGREEEIRECIACNSGCIERVGFEAKSIRCAINPQTGQELECPAQPRGGPQRVVIVGGGPAGLTAAFEAARLGHQVTLFEREDKLGGNVLPASTPPAKETFGRWIEWLAGRVRTMGVKVLTGKKAGLADIQAQEPDAVILATGAGLIIPNLPGVGLPLVAGALDVLLSKAPAGKRVAVIGGGQVGLETADFLAARGARVTVIEMQKNLAVRPTTAHGYFITKRLREAEARMMLETRVTAITEDGLEVKGPQGPERLEGLDQVVLAVGLAPRAGLAEELTAAGVAYTPAGDMRGARRIIEATEEGARAAWAL